MFYTANGLKLFPRTIACRSNETCNPIFTSMLRRAVATSGLHQTTNCTAFPVCLQRLILALFSCSLFLHAIPAEETGRLRSEAFEAIEKLASPTETAGAYVELGHALAQVGDEEGIGMVIERLEDVSPSFSKAAERAQVTDAIAFLQVERGRPGDAMKTVYQIKLPRECGESLLNLAEKILSDRERPPVREQPTTDVLPILRAARLKAKEAKDIGLEVMAGAVLARELMKSGRSGDAEEAKTLFTEVREQAKGLEEIEERDFVAVLILYMIQTGLESEAAALVQGGRDEAVRDVFRARLSLAYLQEKNDEKAEQALKDIRENEAHDNALFHLLLARAERTDEGAPDAAGLEKIVRQANDPAFGAVVLDPTLKELVRAKRYETALEFDRLVGESKSEYLLRSLWIQALCDDGRLSDALAVAGQIREEETKADFLKTIRVAVGFSRFTAGDLEGMKEVLEPLRDETKIKEVAENVAAARKVDDPLERGRQLDPLLNAQFELGDCEGAKETFLLLEATALQIEDPRRRFETLIGLLQSGSRFDDKTLSGRIVGELLATISDVADIPEAQRVRFALEMLSQWERLGDREWVESTTAKTLEMIGTLRDPNDKAGALIALLRFTAGMERHSANPASQ